MPTRRASDATIHYSVTISLIADQSGTRIVTDPLGRLVSYPNVAGDVVTVGKEMYNHNAVGSFSASR